MAESAFHIKRAQEKKFQRWFFVMGFAQMGIYEIAIIECLSIHMLEYIRATADCAYHYVQMWQA